jgi:hypothetical protein
MLCILRSAGLMIVPSLLISCILSFPLVLKRSGLIHFVDVTGLDGRITEFAVLDRIRFLIKLDQIECF